jgi:hypothetical protein
VIKRPAGVAPVSSAPRRRENLPPAMKSKAAGKCPVIPYEEFIALPPDELNSYLRREFQVGLYAFAAMLFEVIREPIKKRRVKIRAHDGWIFWGWHPTENRPMNEAELRNKHRFFAVEMKSLAALNQAGFYPDEGPILDRETLRLLKEKIVTLRKKILDTAAEIEVRRKYVVKTPPRGKSPEDQNALVARWEVGRFLSKLQDEYIDLLAMFPTSGRPSSPEIEAACLWAQHFRSKGMRVPWPLISELMDWFTSRLRRYAYYQKVFANKEASDPDYLRQKFYRQKTRWEMLYPYRRGGRMYLDLIRLGLDGTETELTKVVLVFGRTEAELRSLYRQSRSKAQLEGLSARMLAASIHVLGCTDPRMNAFILPDGSFLAA